MKRLAVILASVLFLLNCNMVNVAADVPPSITPQWEIADSADGAMSFGNKQGVVTFTVYGRSTTTKITATVTLYYKNERDRWVRIPTEWIYSVDSDTLVISETFAAEVGKTYRAVLKSTVYAGTESEPVSYEVIKTY